MDYFKGVIPTTLAVDTEHVEGWGGGVKKEEEEEEESLTFRGPNKLAMEGSSSMSLTVGSKGAEMGGCLRA